MENKQTVICHGEEKSWHPQIYLNVPSDREIKCPYCGKTFKSSDQDSTSDNFKKNKT